jgi:exosortase B
VAVEWRLAGACFSVAMLLSCVYLWNHLWDREAYGHGPIVAVIIAWLAWSIVPPAPRAPRPSIHAVGWLLLAAGVSLWVIGRSLNMPLLDVSALIPLATGLLLIVGGGPALRAYWFPVLFLVFLIPIPSFVLDALTGSLKGKVSFVTEFLLYHAGYPIARSGVVLGVGQYQLLVADACSGLNSIFSLSAMGLLYLYLMRHVSVSRNALLLAAIVPIAVFANLVRVVFLVLLTYHFGDGAGQGFLHGFAGLFVFGIAMLMLFALDRLLGRVPALSGKEAS